MIHDLSQMSLEEIELVVDSYDPFDPAESPSFEPSKQEPLPNLSTEEMMGTAIPRQALSADEIFPAPEIKALKNVSAFAGKAAKIPARAAWKAVGVLAWPFERIEAGLATPATAIMETIGPVLRASARNSLAAKLLTPSKREFKDEIRSGLTPYARQVLGDSLEPTLEGIVEDAYDTDGGKEELLSALSESRSHLPSLIPAFLRGAKSFIPFTRNNPEKVKNFNDLWSAYYEEMTNERAPEIYKQVAGISTSFLATPFVFGKILKTAKAGIEAIPAVQKLSKLKIPEWNAAKLIRKANIYERNEKAVKLGKALANKDTKRIAAQLSRQTGKNVTPEAVKLRLGQIIKGSITQQEALAKAANPAIEALQSNFDELQKLGILGKETYLTKLSKAKVGELSSKKMALQKQLTKLQTGVPYKEKLLSLTSKLKPDSQRLANKLINVAIKAEERGAKLSQIGDEFIDVALEVNTGSKLSQKIATLLDFAPGDKRLTLLGNKLLSLEKMTRKVRNKEANKILATASKISPKVLKFTNQTVDDVLKAAVQVEDMKTIGQKPLLKYIQSMQFRYKGKAGQVRELQEKILSIDDQLYNSTHIGGELYMPRMYSTKEAVVAARKFPVSAKTPKIKAQYAKARKEIPLEVRKRMGEIVEPAYPVTKRLIQEAQDIETTKLFDFVAQRGEWVDDVWREGFALKALPDTKIYGALKGKFVNQKIYDDITELNRIRSDFESLYDSVIGTWKIGKVTLNPATQFRNTFSNSLLLDLSGTDYIAQVKLAVKAIKEIKKGSDEFKIAKKFFARTTMMSGEIFDDMLRTVQAGKASALQKSINMWNKVFEKTTAAPSKLYQQNEFIFKFMKYIEQREKGKSVIGAVQEANKWLFDYGDLSRFEKVVARRIMPFYTFPRKALPRVLEAAAERPLTLAKYPLMASTLEKYSLHNLEITEADYAQIGKILPEYMQSGGYMLMPWRDANDNLQFFDWTYIVPWGELFDVQDKGLAAAVITNPLFQIVADITRNRSGWSGREIYKETDTPKEKTFKQMVHTWQTLVPSLMYKGIYWDKIYESATGKPSKMGEIRPLAPMIAHTIFGLRTQPVDVEKQKQFRLIDKRDQIEELSSKISDIVIRAQNDNITEEEYNERREQYLKQIQGLMDEISEISTVPLPEEKAK